MDRAEGWLEHPVGLSVLRSKGVYRYIQTHRNTKKKGCVGDNVYMNVGQTDY